MGQLVGQLVLRTAWLFLGAAIGLAAALLAISLAGVIGPGVGFPQPLVVAVCMLPFVLLGLLPGVRELEVTAADAMLGVDADRLLVPGQPSGEHRVRTAAWALLHLVAGLLAAVALVGLVPGAVVVALDALRGRSTTIGSWSLPVSDSVPDVIAVVAICLVAVLVCLGIAWALGVLAAAAVPAFLGPTSRDRLEVAEARLAAEAEYLRLARDLHDGIGHALTIISVQAAAGRRVLAHDPETAARALGSVEEAARDALAELDQLLAALRDHAEPGPEPGVERLPALLAAHRAAGMSLRDEGSDPADLAKLPPLVSATIYRVVAEALANAQRHARGAPVELHVRRDQASISVLVENRSHRASAGRETHAPRGGRGLVGLRERLSVLGGSLDAGPEGGCWRLLATIPYEKAP